MEPSLHCDSGILVLMHPDQTFQDRGSSRLLTAGRKQPIKRNTMATVTSIDLTCNEQSHPHLVLLGTSKHISPHKAHL